uniref:FZ domain-containing protein n=1 Tax=Mesocestoides corti TaxID=53468 RepID=A0A5K3EX33_MESCO
MDHLSPKTFCVLLLLCLRKHYATADNEKTQLEQSSLSTGVWINRGQVYPRCSALHFEKLRCANFSLSQRPVTRSRVLRPDCAFLMHRLICSLHKLNCPSLPNASFQMYDIPCQSSCHATVDICGMQSSNSQPTSSHWQTHPKRSAPLYPQIQPRLTPSPSWHPFTPSPGQSVWPWRPYVPSSTRRHQRSLRHSNNKTMKSYSSKKDNKVNELKLLPEDCKFLPSGGCDNWARKIVKNHPYYARDYEAETRQNPACPKDFKTMCAQMFPLEFTKNDWEQGNFTMALIIRISQTFWWFGKFHRFQPFFRFTVKRTLKTDILEYDDKVILTNSWPSSCVCPNKLVVGKKYLLLTHSRISRQTLRISNKTVFLENPKRYEWMILCWMGSCPRQGARQRRYKQNQWNWRWQRLRHR